MSDTPARIAELERQAELDDAADGAKRHDRVMPSSMTSLRDGAVASFERMSKQLAGDDIVEDDPRFRSTPNREQMNLDIAILQYAKRLGVGPMGQEHNHVLCGFARSAYLRAKTVAESPIELDLLPWIITADWSPANTTPVPVALPTESLPPFETDILLVPQFVVGSFRLDFAICVRRNGELLIVAIECDGRDFHDAAKDRRRDWLLKAAGIETVRGSGKEIRENPQQVVDRARRIVAEWGAAP